MARDDYGGTHSVNHVGREGVQVDNRCDTCHKTFPSLKRANEHRKSCGGEDCIRCGKNFSSLKTMKEHYYAKHTEKFKCIHCGKCFGGSSKLTRHMVVHDDSKNVTCSECGKKFSRIDYLNKHKKQVHI